MESASHELLCVFAGLPAVAFQKIRHLDISGVYSSSKEETNFLFLVTMQCSNTYVLNVSVNDGGTIRTLGEGLHPFLMEQLRSLQISLPALPDDTAHSLESITGFCKGLGEFEISIAGESARKVAAKLCGNGTGKLILTNPSCQLVDLLSGLHGNTIALIRDIEINTPTTSLPIDLANKISSFMGSCANTADIDVCIEELSGENDTNLLSLHSGVLRMNPLACLVETFLCLFTGLHQKTTNRVTELQIRVPRMSASTEENLENSIGHCANITKLVVDADGDDVHAIMRKLHQDTLAKVTEMKINLVEQRSAAGIKSLASVIGRFPSIQELDISSSTNLSEDNLLRFSCGSLIAHSSTIHPVLSNLHLNVLNKVVSMDVNAGHLSHSIIGNLPSTVGQCAHLETLVVRGVGDDSTERTVLNVTHESLSLNLDSLALLAFMVELPVNLLEKVTKLKINLLEQGSAAGIKSLASVIERFPSILYLDISSTIYFCEDKLLTISYGLLTVHSPTIHPVLSNLHPNVLNKVVNMDVNAGNLSHSMFGNLPLTVRECSHLKTLTVRGVGNDSTERTVLNVTRESLSLNLVSKTLLAFIGELPIIFIVKVRRVEVTAAYLPPDVVVALTKAIIIFKNVTYLTVTASNGKENTEVLTMNGSNIRLICTVGQLLPVLAGITCSKDNMLAEGDIHLSVPRLTETFVDNVASVQGVLSRIASVSVVIAEGTNDEVVLSLKSGKLSFDPRSAMLLPLLQRLIDNMLTKEEDIHLSVQQLTDTFADYVASVLEVLSGISTVLIVIAEGTRDEVVLSLKNGKLTIDPLSPTLVPLLERLTEEILMKINGIDIRAPEMTDEVEIRFINIFKKSPNLRAVALHQCKSSEVDTVLNALHDDIVGKIENLWITLIDSFSSSDDKLGAAIGQFSALDEFHLQWEELGLPQSSLAVRDEQLSVTGPRLLALMSTMSLHVRTLEKVRRVHISGYSPDEQSVELLKKCIGMCSNVKQMAFDVARGDDVKCFMGRIDENSLAQLEHLQVQSPELPTPLAVQLSSINRSCSSVCSILVSQKYQEKQQHGPPADLPVISLQGSGCLTIRLCSEAGEIVVVKTEQVNLTSLLERVHQHSPEKVQLMTVSAPFMTMSAAQKLASFIGQFSAFTSLSICIDKGTKDEASMILDRHHLRLQNMSEVMVPIIAGLHESIKIEIHTLDIKKSSFQPESSHHWPFIPSLSNLSNVAIENSFLNLHGSCPSLLLLVEQCRRLSSMRGISIWQCGTDGLDRFESYMDSHTKTRASIEVNVKNVSPEYTFHRSLSWTSLACVGLYM